VDLCGILVVVILVGTDYGLDIVKKAILFLGLPSYLPLCHKIIYFLLNYFLLNYLICYFCMITWGQPIWVLEHWISSHTHKLTTPADTTWLSSRDQPVYWLNITKRRLYALFQFKSLFLFSHHNMNQSCTLWINLHIIISKTIFHPMSLKIQPIRKLRSVQRYLFYKKTVLPALFSWPENTII
jgi:hypothetical protein